MKKSQCVVFLLICIQSIVFAQTGPMGVSKVMAWFRTTRDLPTDQEGRWEELSQYDLDLYLTNSAGAIPGVYYNDLYSMNFNPSLHFNGEHEFKGETYMVDQYSFKLNKNFRRLSTIIAVLVPEKRTDNSTTEWALFHQNTREAPSRILNIDKVLSSPEPGQGFELDYGDGIGTDLDISNESPNSYEAEKYGKIVTYDAIIDPNYCGDPQKLSRKIFELYSEDPYGGDGNRQQGEIPEFIVFDHVLTKAERFRVETYLAMKYGISKELNYEVGAELGDAVIWDATQWTDYGFRITGIGAGGDINQARSTSYYDEKSIGRKNKIEETNDYSHHADRLLVMGTADESSDMYESWQSGFAVWGDDDADLETFDMSATLPGFVSLNRKWAMQFTGAASKPASGIAWANVNDFLINGSGQSKVFKKRFDQPNRPASAASSTSTEGIFSTFSWKIVTPAKNDNNFIGFSTDNSVFQNFANPFDGFIVVAIYNSDGTFDVHADLIGNDGIYDTQISSGQSYQTGDYHAFAILDNNPDYREISMFVNSSKLLSEKQIKENINYCESSTLVYSKLLFEDYDFSVNINNSAGFKPSAKGEVNVELSVTTVDEVFQTPDVEEPIYLLIDQSGTGNFPLNDTEIHRGHYSKTPFGFYDKVEFYNIPFELYEEGVGDVFTFATGCDESSLTVEVVPHCCGDIADVQISFENVLCAARDVEYFLVNELGETVSVGELDFEGICLSDLAVGNYQLCVIGEYFSFTEYFEIINENFIPNPLFVEHDFSVPPHSGSLDLILNLSPDLITTADIEFCWTTPDGQPGSGDVLEFMEIGDYKVQIKFNCDMPCDEPGCVREDTVTATCEPMVVVEIIDYCCKNGAAVNFDISNCNLNLTYTLKKGVAGIPVINHIDIPIDQPLPQNVSLGHLINGTYTICLNSGLEVDFVVDNIIEIGNIIHYDDVTIDDCTSVTIVAGSFGLINVDTIIYAWSGTQPFQDLGDRIIVDQPGTYFLEMTIICENGLSCVYTDQVNVEAELIANIDFVVEEDCCGYGGTISFTLSGCVYGEDLLYCLNGVDEFGMAIIPIVDAADFFEINQLPPLANGMYELGIKTSQGELLTKVNIEINNIADPGLYFLNETVILQNGMAVLTVGDNVPSGYEIICDWGEQPAEGCSLTVTEPGTYCVDITLICEENLNDICDLSVEQTANNISYSEVFPGLGEGEVLTWRFAPQVVPDQFIIRIGGHTVVNTGAATKATSCYEDFGQDCSAIPVSYVGDLYPYLGQTSVNLTEGLASTHIIQYIGTCQSTTIDYAEMQDKIGTNNFDVVLEGNILIHRELAGLPIEIEVVADPCDDGNTAWAFEVDCGARNEEAVMCSFEQCFEVKDETQHVCDVTIEQQCGSAQEDCSENVTIIWESEGCVGNATVQIYQDNKIIQEHELITSKELELSDLEPGPYEIIVIFPEDCRCSDFSQSIVIDYCCFDYFDLLEQYCVNDIVNNPLTLNIGECFRCGHGSVQNVVAWQNINTNSQVSTNCEATIKEYGTYQVCVTSAWDATCTLCDEFKVFGPCETSAVIAQNCLGEMSLERTNSKQDLDYEIWNQPSFYDPVKIYSGRISGETKTVIFVDLPDGAYQIVLSGEKSSVAEIQTYMYTRQSLLPREILDENVYFINEQENKITLNAGVNVNSELAVSYQWFDNDGKLVATKAKIDLGPGLYRVQVQSEECIQEDEVLVQLVNSSRKILPTMQKANMQVNYVNPMRADQDHWIYVTQSQPLPVTMQVYSIDGKRMQSQSKSEGTDLAFPIRHQPGVYLVRLFNSIEQKTIKIVIQ